MAEASGCGGAAAFGKCLFVGRVQFFRQAGVDGRAPFFLADFQVRAQRAEQGDVETFSVGEFCGINQIRRNQHAARAQLAAVDLHLIRREHDEKIRLARRHHRA